ncbi:hypothetical protein FKG94_03125 [Exilibacterium tricleocarpae]|uniref:Phage tail protein n=1 Tax=Exilibacterium tricleocarpae TaxID=2591008 RepID=A0A545U6V1_9GAMM|nr:phage tail protein [Exilibacterium tricleocarpae]TQV85196.1 hypothetical protein FKG94_03125 [Exilibacterium tricleocarpae]
MTVSPQQQAARLARKLNRIAKRDTRLATNSALNKAAQRVNTRVVRGLSRSIRVPQKLIRQKIFISRSTLRTLRVLYKVYAKDISFVQLLTKGQIGRSVGTGTNRRGVRARGRQIDHAFIQRGKSGNLHVFTRQGKFKRVAGPRGGRRVELIDVERIAIQAEAERITAAVSTRVMRKDYFRLLQQDLNFRLSKYGRRT